MLFRTIRLLAAMASDSLPALAQTPGGAPPGWLPQGANPATGARPGNEIGTGMSLPLSNKAGNIIPQDTTSPIAGRLPESAVAEKSTVRDFLIAARNALTAGRTGEAQEVLERAGTRALDRSVPLFQTTAPIQDPLIEHIEQVLHRLGQGDLPGTMRLLDPLIAEAPP